MQIHIYLGRGLSVVSKQGYKGQGNLEFVGTDVGLYIRDDENNDWE